MSLDLEDLRAYCDFLDDQQGEVDVAAIVDLPLVEPTPLHDGKTTRRRYAVAAAVVITTGAGLGVLLDRESDLETDTTTATGPAIDDESVTRTVISPLVELQAALVDQSESEMFSVDVAPGDNDYWRLMSLVDFDGGIWRASSNFETVALAVPSDLDRSVPVRRLIQTITTDGLGNIYLPVAYELSRVTDNGGVELEYEAESGALVVASGSIAATVDGFTYTIESSVPVIDGARLDLASTDSLSATFLERYTDLPVDFPPSIGEEAERITEEATSTYDRALALQNHFQTKFTYDNTLAMGHNSADLESFLFDTQVGQAEHFASAFAVMARTIGLPTRVAVGFTWGDWDPDRCQFVVRGEHAHAWPEIYFAGTGWVRFEPTPGRGGPNDGPLTGLEPGQAGDDGAGGACTTADIYSAAIDSILGAEAQAGDEFPTLEDRSIVYVLDHADPRVATLFCETDDQFGENPSVCDEIPPDAAPTRLSSAVRSAIEAALPETTEVEFVKSREDVTEAAQTMIGTRVINDGVLLELGPVIGQGETVHVSVRCIGCGAIQWLLRLEMSGDVWVVEPVMVARA